MRHTAMLAMRMAPMIALAGAPGRPKTYGIQIAIVRTCTTSRAQCRLSECRPNQFRMSRSVNFCREGIHAGDIVTTRRKRVNGLCAAGPCQM